MMMTAFVSVCQHNANNSMQISITFSIQFQQKAMLQHTKLTNKSPYPSHEGKTFAQILKETKRSMVAVAYTGSHCPFLCKRNKWLPLVKDPWSGGYMLNNWADQVSIEYYRAALDIYHDRRYL